MVQWYKVDGWLWYECGNSPRWVVDTTVKEPIFRVQMRRNTMGAAAHAEVRLALKAIPTVFTSCMEFKARHGQCVDKFDKDSLLHSDRGLRLLPLRKNATLCMMIANTGPPVSQQIPRQSSRMLWRRSKPSTHPMHKTAVELWYRHPAQQSIALWLHTEDLLPTMLKSQIHALM